jgi:hypothetical protein
MSEAPPAPIIQTGEKGKKEAPITWRGARGRRTMGGAMTGFHPHLDYARPTEQSKRASIRPDQRRTVLGSAALYCWHVRACHLQADLGRDRRPVRWRKRSCRKPNCCGQCSMSAIFRRCDRAGVESRMRKAMSLAALLIMITSYSVAQSQMARTVDITTACQNEDDFSRYATLLKDDAAAAIMFRNDHSCIVFSAHIVVRIGSRRTDA